MKRWITTPDVKREVARARGIYAREIRRAAIDATDRASREGVIELRAKMRSAGLGRLGNAVGQTSLKRKSGSSSDTPYGVWFARGGDESQGGGTLEAYSRGTKIRPKSGNGWLWIPTRAVQRIIGRGRQRRRLTPALWIGSSLEQSVGKLEFRPISSNRAVLVIKRVSLSPKTGRAKALGPGRTRTRIPVKEVIAFVGIRFTSRIQRFDKDAVAAGYSRRVPTYMTELLSRVT